MERRGEERRGGEKRGGEKRERPTSPLYQNRNLHTSQLLSPLVSPHSLTASQTHMTVTPQREERDTMTVTPQREDRDTGSITLLVLPSLHLILFLYSLTLPFVISNIICKIVKWFIIDSRVPVMREEPLSDLFPRLNFMPDGAVFEAFQFYALMLRD